MNESQVIDAGLARGWWLRAYLPAAPIAARRCELAAIAALCPILLSVALWNNYPIIFYDTGAYILQGLGGVFIMERSPVYSLFLRFGSASWSLWLVVTAQALMSAFVMVETARAEAPRISLWRLLGIGAILSAVTGLAWYVGEVEPDCMTALVALSFYLIAFRARELGVVRTLLLAAIGALSVSMHPSHLGLAAGLVLVIAAVRIAAWFLREKAELPRARIGLPLASFAVGFGLVLAANYSYTSQIFVSRAGPVFLSARMMQDGIVKRLLDDTCPGSQYKLCDYKDELPARADAWLWERISPFNRRLGAFKGMEKESAAIVKQSLVRYPWTNLKAALGDSALQFVLLATGDGIDPQEWVLDNEFKHYLPRQLTGYLDARQQRGELQFGLLNLIHVSVAALSLLGLAMLLWRDRRQWNRMALPAIVLAALIGNAVICGVASGPHSRYQSRIAWLPTFVLLLQTGAAGGLALRRQVESVT